MVNNIDELIGNANQIEDIEERIKYVLHYFLDNIQYNYAYLFLKGYAQGTVSKISDKYKLEPNPLKGEELEEFVLTRSIVEGESEIYNAIIALRDNSKGDYYTFIRKLREYIKTELSTHIDNNKIVSKNTQVAMNRIMECLCKKTIVNYKGIQFNVSNDISTVLTDFFLNPRKYLTPNMEHGILENGVCEDYAEYLTKLFQYMGIEAHKVDGTSELGHSWVVVKVGNEYKSIDLTRAVFIRDGFKGIPAEQTSEDWLYCSLEDGFRMQETRTITEIDGIKLNRAINGQNFNGFEELLQEVQNRGGEGR